MSLLAIIRHGATDWNRERRLQGRADRPLSARGKLEVRRWHLPPLLRDACWTTSPLHRAKETAAMLGHPDCSVEPALIEMDWGKWEGRTREELIAEAGLEAVERNPLGRDFRPPNGESPRQVWYRLSSWIGIIASAGTPAVAITHRGVIRAIYAEATGWDMIGPPADELSANAAHLFLARSDGSVGLIRANLMLT
jgi:2,3-bisphosphoglycerate-dependent phosphoglycerate mutase